MVYVLKIKKSNTTGATLKEVEKYLKTSFKSYDYLQGFCDGYLFDNYFIVNLEKFEQQLNNTTEKQTDIYYIKFVIIESESE